MAEDVTKVHAICVRCGNLAHVSHRIVNKEQRVLLGEQDEYEPLCRHCYNQLCRKFKSLRIFPLCDRFTLQRVFSSSFPLRY